LAVDCGPQSCSHCIEIVVQIGVKKRLPLTSMVQSRFHSGAPAGATVTVV
jgi:hypothetical protein